MKWDVTIDDEGMITLPEEALKVLDWKEGDELEWIDRGDGSFLLRKPDEVQTEG